MIVPMIALHPQSTSELDRNMHGSEIRNKQKAYTGNGYRQKENAGRVIAIATDEETANFVYTQAIQSLPSPNGTSIFTKSQVTLFILMLVSPSLGGHS